MRLKAIIVSNEATPIDYVISQEFISYFQELDSKKILVDLEKYYSLIESDNEKKLCELLEKWRNEERVMTHEQLDKFNNYFKGAKINKNYIEISKKYNDLFSKEFYQELEQHISSSFPLPSSGISIFFKEVYNIELKNAIYLDSYGNICVSFNQRKIFNDITLSSIAIYEESNEKKIVIPKIDSTGIILSVFETKIKNHNLNIIEQGRIFRKKDIKILVDELMETELDFQGYGLSKVGLYGHVHKKPKNNSQKITAQDMELFDISQINDIITTEEHFYNGKIFELVSNDFVKYLNKSDLDFFMQQIRMLHDSLFQGTDKSYRVPERTFILHFTNNGKNYAVAEKSKLMIFDNNESHYNRFGTICVLENKGKSLENIVKFCESKLNEMESKAYKKEITKVLF